ncbi:uncharacterized protein LOC657476 [Tribolium castaneum]|uniref:Uncharacterized protein n=1 Tax=Tribolium castaneum TaxID=7070 RepID=D6WFU5_TRICA|nr:PREDICTED: uncharacterized protein LOC657476 [Tribolium castaneum]EFA00513.1 hypothetical protein TcasGA2_TC003377 [Tribolium castaneum]|eukprot:XP_969027.1 PREDICTED: uncharacterized protein LOC657476 [Tribolium castaneum]
MSPDSKKVCFKNFERQHKIPFVIYAHIESARIPTPGQKSVFVQKPCGFAYSIKCCYDRSLSKCESYYGEDCVSLLWKLLKREAKEISEKLKTKVEPLGLNEEQINQISKLTKCYLCSEALHEDKDIDFHPLTGDYLGLGHKECRGFRKIPKSIPVVVSKNGLTFLLGALSKGELDEILFICGNKEGRFGFMTPIPGFQYLKFVESCKFLDEEFENQDRILSDSKKKGVRRWFKALSEFDLMKRKTWVPFLYLDSFDKLTRSDFPPPSGFYDELEDEEISPEEYDRAVRIWTVFGCETVGDYLKLCLESSVLLLGDVFESFRMLCLDKYKLDPFHYFTIASFAWDVMLKHIKVKLELLEDQEMIAFIKDNIRGGIVQCSKRYALANNRFCQLDQTKPHTFIVYLDANNLGGWAMSQCLPFSEFRWMSRNEIEEIAPKVGILEEEGAYGYIFEVDLDYPKKLHEKHNDLPFCYEHLTVPELGQTVRILNFYNKRNYVMDFRNLKQCLSNGLILKKIHRVLQFKQSKWLQPYIAYNTNLRASAVSDIEKKLYKLLNNSVFGKTIQRLSTDKPIYAGFCILELSKKFMYDFHYKIMLSRYPQRINLLYMDTDSFIYEIQTCNFFRDLQFDEKLLELFDTSNLDKRWGIPPRNKKVPGKMKDECDGKVVREFCGVGAKVYCLDVDGEEVKKAMGVRKYVKRKYISVEDYRNCVLGDVTVRRGFLETGCKNYELKAYWVKRDVLMPGDKKRRIRENKVDTDAWGPLVDD